MSNWDIGTARWTQRLPDRCDRTELFNLKSWIHMETEQLVSQTNADSQQRNLPARGFRPGILLLGMGAVMGFGWYKLIHGMREAKYVPLTQQPQEEHQIINSNTASLPVKRCGLASTSSPSSRPKRTATRCDDTWPTRSARRSCWATTPRSTTATGEPLTH